jgi:hypothetical protein
MGCMPTKRCLILFTLMASISVAFNACWLAGSVYRSVDEPKRPGMVPKLITLENCTVKVYLWATTKKDTTTFEVRLHFDPSTKAGPLILSHIKIDLRSRPEKPEHFILQSIESSQRSVNGHRSLETLPDSAVGNTSIDGNAREDHFLIYHFANIAQKHHFHEMQVLLEANVEDGSHTAIIKQEMVFKRYFYVDIAGN